MIRVRDSAFRPFMFTIADVLCGDYRNLSGTRGEPICNPQFRLLRQLYKVDIQGSLNGEQSGISRSGSSRVRVTVQMFN